MIGIQEALNKAVEDNRNLEKENKRLHSIIKEVREYIEKEQKHQMIWGTITLGKESQKELLEILDKAGDEK